MDQRYSIVLVGVGSCGCQALGRLNEEWTEAPDMVALHTNQRVLDLCGAPHRLLLGPNVTRGLSTGGDPELGRKAAAESLDGLRPAFEGADLVLVLVGLGGGTGTGAAPLVCRAARDAGALVLAFCTLPFFFEGLRKRRIAEESLSALREQTDALIVLPNERLMSQNEEGVGTNLAFRLGDRLIGENLRALWKLLWSPGVLNVDLADLRRFAATGGGTLAMASGEGHGPGKAEAALLALEASPLLEHGAVLSAAKGMLVSVIGGPDLTLNDLNQIVGGITAKATPDVDLRVGAVVDDGFEGRVVVSVFATENRVAPAVPPAGGETPAAVTAAGAEAGAEDEKGRGKSRRGAKGKPAVQQKLDIDGFSQGRFSGLESTFHEGQNLDVPTYLRRNIRLTVGPTA